MRNRLLGLLTTLTLLGAGTSFAAQNAGVAGDPKDPRQSPSAAAGGITPQGTVTPSSTVAGPDGKGNERSIGRLTERLRIITNEGLNKSPGSSGGGYTSNSPYSQARGNQRDRVTIPTIGSAAGFVGTSTGVAQVTVQEGTRDNATQPMGGMGGSGIPEEARRPDVQQAQAEAAQGNLPTLTGTVQQARRGSIELRDAQGRTTRVRTSGFTAFANPKVRSARGLAQGEQVAITYRCVGKTKVAQVVSPVASGGQGIGGAGMEVPATGGNCAP